MCSWAFSIMSAEDSYQATILHFMQCMHDPHVMWRLPQNDDDDEDKNDDDNYDDRNQRVI